jgi:Ca-activated chloride channel family protein
VRDRRGVLRFTFALVLALYVSAPATPAAGRQVFRTSVDGVAVDVLVTRGKRPVTGLRTADFTLRDSGVPQRIQSVMLEDVPITLLLVLDASASVDGDLLKQLKSAAQAAADALRPVDRIGLFTFSDRVRLVVDPPAPVSALAPELQQVVANGDTMLFDATFAALTIRERLPGRVLLLVFSDGDDTSSWLHPHDVLAAAQRSDVVVHAVVVGKLHTELLTRLDGRTRRWFESEPHLFSSVYLPCLVEDTGGSIHLPASGGLREVFVRVVNEFRSRYVLTYVPEAVSASGWHDIEVQVRGRGMQVQARRGYLR